MNSYSFDSVCYTACPVGTWKTLNSSGTENGTCMPCSPACTALVNVNPFERIVYGSK